MNIIEREIESNSGGILLLVEIVYDCEPSYYGSIDGGRLTYRLPGRVDLVEVNVLAVTGYDTNGQVVYDYEHRALSKERLAHLDEVAFSIVENDICDGGRIYEAMWEKGS